MLGAILLAGSVDLLLHQGFVGLSDDDAARSLIAWDWARAPSLDPTRSSWLPVHTYLVGSTLRLFPSLLVTPRAVSLAAGILACLLLALVA